MEKTLGTKVCHQVGCKILEGGSCLEGLDITKEECPHFYLEEIEETEENDTVPSARIETKSVVQLFTGKEMSFNETALITNNEACKLIVIVGESKCGKTTLLAEYFINFQKGPFCNYLFAGSLTQIGFEKRCFEATIGSGNLTPRTQRTTSREFGFLHLALKTTETLTSPCKHFLFSDISGEMFRDAKTSTILMTELSILKSADFILFLLDGEKIADLNTRNFAIEEAKTFIQKALDERIIDDKTNLKIVLAKSDAVNEDASFNFESRIITPFSKRFSSRLRLLEFCKISARSKSNKVASGMGMCDLLRGWDEDEVITHSTKLMPKTIVNSDRAFHRFTFPIE